jgi:glycosyltransferase involved in cell wall biosynthesis
MIDRPIAVSVIIPCRNAAGTIGAAIRTARDQTLPPVEVIVVDDGSTDASVQVARAGGARVERLERRGCAGGARNRGIEVARGDVLAFVDADVEIARDWLERVAHVLRDPTIVGVGGRIENGRPGRFGELDHLLNHSEWMAGPSRACGAFPTMAVAYRRSAIGDVRFPATNLGEDQFFALGVQARGGRFWYDAGIRIVHKHERLDRHRFWQRQLDAGRSIFVTRAQLDRPGRILVRAPALLFLYPHLWIVLGRMVRAGMIARAVALLPWLVAGETARIAGFLEARRGAFKALAEPAEAVR